MRTDASTGYAECRTYNDNGDWSWGPCPEGTVPPAGTPVHETKNERKAREAREAASEREGQRREGDYSYIPDLSLDDLQRDDIAYGRDQNTRDRWDEDHRKGRVDSGSNMINAHFGGGTYGTGQVDWSELPFAFDTGGLAEALQPVYEPDPDGLRTIDRDGGLGQPPPGGGSWVPPTHDGEVHNPGGAPGPTPPVFSHPEGTGDFMDWALGQTLYDAMGNPVTDPTKILEMGPKGQLFTGSGQADNPFDDSFYAAQGNAYKDWANPQIQTQYQDANRGLTFALSGAGHSAGSSTMIDRNDRLQMNNAQALQDVGRTATNVENQSRQNIENEKMDLLTLNQANADPTEMASLLPGRISTASTPQQDFNPLGEAFRDVSAGVGQYIHGRNMAQGYGGNMNLPPIYGGPAGSSSGRNYS